MGATFPLLMAVIRQTARPGSERSFSYLYVANVVGALIGTLASAFVLIEFLGFQGTLYVAGALNALLALTAFRISFGTGSASIAETVSSVETPRTRLYGLPPVAIPIFLFISGFVSMSLEVIWIRQFTPYLGNVVYCFAGILAVYLLGTVMGSQDYRSSARRQDPGSKAVLWSWLAFSAMIPVFAADPMLRIGHFDLGFLRVASIGFFCALAGFLTPLLVDTWSAGDPDRAGSAYAVNIAGSIAGPLVAGFWLLPVVGERWGVLILSVPLFVIAGLAVLRTTPATAGAKSGLSPKLGFALALAATILLFVFSHDFETKFASREVRRDYMATSIAMGKGTDPHLLVNGIGMTGITPITKYIVHLPLAFLRTPPRNGLVICFGMGTSFRSMVSWGIPTTAVELVPSVPSLFGYYYPDAEKVRNAPGARIVIDDGRRFLDGSNETYDVILTDPPPPDGAAGSSLLYSREFTEVVKKHLSKGGVFQEWLPYQPWDPDLKNNPVTKVAVAKALMETFPYVRAFQSFDGRGIHFLASNEPLETTSGSTLAARMPAAAAADFVEWGPKKTTAEQFDDVLANEIPLDKLVAESPETPAIRDDEPINEYYLMRGWFNTAR